MLRHLALRDVFVPNRSQEDVGLCDVSFGSSTASPRPVLALFIRRVSDGSIGSTGDRFSIPDRAWNSGLPREMKDTGHKDSKFARSPTSIARLSPENPRRLGCRAASNQAEISRVGGAPLNRLEQLIAREITNLMALRVLIKDGAVVTSPRHQARDLAQVEAQLADLGINVDELA